METIAALQQSLDGDLSVWALFARAHWVVQGVILLLVAFSVLSWGIIFEKLYLIGRAARTSIRFETVFWSGRSLSELSARLGDDPQAPMERVFLAGMREWEQTMRPPERTKHGLLDRIERLLRVAVSREVEQLSTRLGTLASIGSVSPFIGLFGTVWGIKNSFESIALSQNTSLAIVAPGIAEALLATALGLFAAIPAVVAYNYFVNRVGGIGDRFDNFVEEFASVISRELDKR